MDFSDIKDRVAQETGLDLDVDGDLVTAWVNAAYKKICGLFNWPWLLTIATIQTQADITTGTVTIAAGSAALTFSSAPTQSVANQYMIQFTDVSDDWYIISAHQAGSTSATLSVPFNGTANLSGATYLLRKVFYTLPANLDRIIDARQARTDTKLGAIDIRAFDRYLPDPTATGDPLFYSMCGLDENQSWQITLYPIPSTTENVQIRYLYMPEDMEDDTDTPILPQKFHDAIVYGALYLYGHDFIDDTRVINAKSRYMEAIKDMKDNYSPIPDQFTILQPWDTRPRRIVGRLPYPPNFPEYFR
jgi:hypothetical protein